MRSRHDVLRGRRCSSDGIVLASDSRTNAGVDNFATFCKMTVFERAGDRVHRVAELRQPGRERKP